MGVALAPFIPHARSFFRMACKEMGDLRDEQSEYANRIRNKKRF